MLQWNHGKSGQVFHFSVSVYKMFLQIKKHGGNNEKSPKPKAAACQLPLLWIVYLLLALNGKPHLNAWPAKRGSKSSWWSHTLWFSQITSYRLWKCSLQTVTRGDGLQRAVSAAWKGEVWGGWVTTVLGFLYESVMRCRVEEGTDFLLFPF